MSSEIVEEEVPVINRNDERIVCGFIRWCQSLLPFKQNVFYTIPELVTTLCSLYYLIPEEWNAELKGSAIIIEQNRCIKEENQWSSFQSVFGSNIVGYGHHEWTFKVIKISNDSYGVWFGITEIDECITTSFITSGGTGYAWVLNYCFLDYDGTLDKEYGKKVKPQDIIQMIFDFNQTKPSLKFIVNKDDYGNANFKKDIDTNSKYRMGITFYGYPNEVELLDYCFDSKTSL